VRTNDTIEDAMNTFILAIAAAVAIIPSSIADAQRPPPDVAYMSVTSTVSLHVAAIPEPVEGIELSASGTRYGDTYTIDLTWSGAPGSTVDLYRNGVKLANTANDGTYRDVITVSGTGATTYKVCGTGSTTCSKSLGLRY
jgi:hypothetical protein